MVKAAPTKPVAAAAGAASYILSDGVSQRVIQPGHSETIQAVPGRRYKLVRMVSGGAKPVAEVIAIADGGTDHGDLRLMTGDHTEIVIRDFFKAPDTSIDIPRPDGDTLTLDRATTPLSRGADGSDLVGMAGTRSGLFQLADDFGRHFDVLAADRFATAMVWSGAAESAAPAAAASASGGLFGASAGAVGTASAIGSSGLSVGAGALAGLGAVLAGVVGVAGSGTSSSSTTNTDTNTTTDPLAPVISVEAISTDNRINAIEYEAIIGNKDTVGTGLTITGSTQRVEDGEVLTVDWAGKQKTATVANGKWSVTYAPTDLWSLADVADIKSFPISVTVSNSYKKSSTVNSVLPVDLSGNITVNELTGDNNLNSLDLANGITVTGTTDLENGQEIIVNLGSVTKKTVASSGAWSASFTASEMPATGTNTSFYVSGNDAAGNLAGSFATIMLDRTAAIQFNATSGNKYLNASEVLAPVVVSGSTLLEAGQTISVTWGITTKNATVIAGQSQNSWSIQFEVADIPAQDARYTISATGKDVQGRSASATTDLTIDREVPTIAINAISSNDRVNSTEAAAGVIITGTTDAANGATVTVVWNNVNQIGTVTNGAWTVTFPTGQIPVDGQYAVSATVKDAAENIGSATRGIIVDKTAPAITISDIASDNAVDTVAKLAGIIINGTAEAEDGQTVTVIWGSIQKTATVSNGAWSVSYALDEVPQNGTTTVTANVSDAAGNAATPATKSVSVDAALLLASIGHSLPGFSVVGQGAEQAGEAVSHIGDVNGDGLADQIIGQNTTGGRVYVVYGHTGSSPVDLNTVSGGIGGFFIEGASARAYIGQAISAAGDVNGDGYADLLVGSTADAPGTAFVLFGNSSGANIQVSAVAAGSDPGFAIIGEASGDAAGYSVSYAGDFNGDGLADILVTAPSNDTTGADGGRAYVIFGKTGSTAVDLANLGTQEGFALAGLASTGYRTLASYAGDVNGDGLADLIVSTPLDFSGKGGAYILFGSTSSGLAPTFFDQVGGSGADTLSDAGTPKSFAGGAGNDLIQLSAASVAYGGAGNDTFELGTQSVITALESNLGSGGNIGQLSRIDGGNGIDTLKLTGGGMILDLGAIANHRAGTAANGLDRLSSIEVIDLTGTGNNTLKLSVADVLDLGGSNIFNDHNGGSNFGPQVAKHQLLVNHDAGDTVDLTDLADWSVQGQNVQWNGADYQVFYHNTASAALYVAMVP